LDSPALRVATGSADYEAKVWDALTGSELTSFTHKGIVRSVRFTNDDKKLITGCHDKALRFFDLQATSSEPVELTGHTEMVKSIALTDRSQALFTGAADGIRVWDLRAGTQSIAHIPRPVSSLELSKDEKYLVAASGRDVLFYDTKSFTISKQFTMEVDIHSASLSPDGKEFIVGADFWVRVHDSEGNQKEVLKGHHGPVLCTGYAPDGNTFASGSEDGTIRLWQVGDGNKTYGLWQNTKKAS
jgi:serine-threonine kinase receptor-associated protein